MKIHELFEGTSPISDQLKNKYDLQTFFVFDDGTDLTLDMIEVSKESRKQGIGTAVMNDLTAFADQENKRIILSVGLRDSLHGTTSRGRLVRFYKRFGFVENKGRNKDFTISPGMYRIPQ